MKLRSNKTQLRKFQKNAKLKKGNLDENLKPIEKEGRTIKSGTRGHKRHASCVRRTPSLEPCGSSKVIINMSFWIPDMVYLGSKQSLRGKPTKRPREKSKKIEDLPEESSDGTKKISEDDQKIALEENAEVLTEDEKPIEDAFEVEDDEDEDDDENLEEVLQAINQNSKTSSSDKESAVESEIVTAPSGEKFEFTFYPTNEKGEKPAGNEFEIECVESMEEMEIPDIAVKQEKNDVTVKLSDDDVMANLDGRCFCQVIVHKPKEYPGCVHFKAGQRTYRCPRCSERLGSLGDYIRNELNSRNFI